jgi:hypothetical protein
MNVDNLCAIKHCGNVGLLIRLGCIFESLNGLLLLMITKINRLAEEIERHLK